MRKYYKGFVPFSWFRRVSFSWDGVKINVLVVKIKLKCTITYISFYYCYFVSYFLNGFTWGLQITLFLLFTLFLQSLHGATTNILNRGRISGSNKMLIGWSIRAESQISVF